MYKNKYFGTDGFRGEANVTLTSTQAYRTGRFLGWYYSSKNADRRTRIVLGKDTRLSSYTLEYSIAAGLSASGADVYMLHVTTTPGVSYVTVNDGFDLGIMITASHNPFTDNGIKVINRYGEKLDDEKSALIERYIDGDLAALGVDGEDLPFAIGDKIGRITDYVAGRNRYVGYLVSLASHSYKKLRIGLDCANGACFGIAPGVFGALGARVRLIGAEPNGTNVNLDCGSTHIEALQKLVREEGLDVGFAFDGDGDRCIAVDENGEVTDGDAIMYVLARRLKRCGMLKGDTLVTTVMSNGGLSKSLEKQGIKCVETAVGDRFVYESMQNNGFSLGGEQSGHVIIDKYATTGDGILSAIIFLEEMLDTGSTPSELKRGLSLYPQLTVNVRVSDKDAATSDERVTAELEKVKTQIAGNGRILLRKSGTENVLRIMVECESDALCAEYAARVKQRIEEGGYAI